MNLVDPANGEAVAANLINDIKAHNSSLTAGDVGYRYLLLALGQAGAADVVYAMNSRTDVPGYGYQLKRGATALTESWQANTNASNNHLMLGHLMEWFYGDLAGIRDEPTSIAGKEISIHPQLAGDITMASARYESPYGLVGSRWEKKASGLEMTVRVPVNTTATIWVPTDKSGSVTEGQTPVDQVNGIVFVRHEKGYNLCKVGSGNYIFRVGH